MYKAVNVQNGQDIIILHPRWARAISELRSLDHQDILVCQGCRQPVRVRAGGTRLWHFAHKHLANCSYEQGSPALLGARAALYEWLTTKFGESVTLEKTLDANHFPRPVDCWVESEACRIAYWIVDAPLKAQTRDSIKQGFQQLGVMVNWVFVARMLREREGAPDSIHLTTTEREFMQQTGYDEMVSGSLFVGKSLHYLDADTHTLTTFRGLQLVHSPQLFEGHKESHEMSAVLVAPGNGEFVHPGEHERLKDYRQEKGEREERQKQLERSSPPKLLVTACTPQATLSEVFRERPTPQVEQWSGYAQREAPCEFCGKTTADWWSYDGNTGLCKCRECSRQGKWCSGAA